MTSGILLAYRNCQIFVLIVDLKVKNVKILKSFFSTESQDIFVIIEVVREYIFSR